jgi:ABC-type glutathione transport system ATPase component
VVKEPVKQVKAYDPYDEEYSPPPPDDPPSAADGSPDAEDPSFAAEEEAQKAEEESLQRDREQEEAERKTERDTDEFVEMSFARASAIVTQLMNDEAMVRRLKEVSFFGFSVKEGGLISCVVESGAGESGEEAVG